MIQAYAVKQPRWRRMSMATLLACFFFALVTIEPSHANDEPPVPAATAQQRPTPPRNASSQRYEINQTFGGQAYYKDNNVWTYDKPFADLFGMPPQHVDPALKGLVAIAFGFEDAPFQECGFAGRADACRKVEDCHFDLYFDEGQTPLPWASDMRSQWLPRYTSARWLRPLDIKEKPYGMLAPDAPPGIIRNEVSRAPIVAFADPQTKRQAIFTSNQYYFGSDPHARSSGMAVLGYSRLFYRSISVVRVQAGCTPFSRTTLDISLDARKGILEPVIARFNAVHLPEKFIERIKAVIEERRRPTENFLRDLPIPPARPEPATSQPAK